MVRNLISREEDADDDSDENHHVDGDGEMGMGIETGQGEFQISSGATGTMNDELRLYRRSEALSSKEVDEESFDSDDSDAEPCQIEWIGGGRNLRVLERQDHDDGTREIFHSFIMYGEGTSERALQRKLGCRIRSRDPIAMKRISIPGPVSIPTGRSGGASPGNSLRNPRG